eukprot:356518-Chlamydomonas_euryale.AAC.2
MLGPRRRHRRSSAATSAPFTPLVRVRPSRTAPHRTAPHRATPHRRQAAPARHESPPAARSRGRRERSSKAGRFAGRAKATLRPQRRRSNVL